MAKTENSLNRLFRFTSTQKPYCSNLFALHMTYVSYVIFGISEPFSIILL